tara:strand:+ start:2034 stop:2246 length:213 start_codon:yes stop_codon:yes gene_type:complete
MKFSNWLALYNNSRFTETKVSLLSFLEQGHVQDIYLVDKKINNYKIINNILERKYKLQIETKSNLELTMA